MTPDKIKKMIDTFFLAKRIRDLLPELPNGVTPSFIHYLDTIHKLESQDMRVKISDIGDTLGLPRPGVTRTVKEMEAKGYLRKISSEEDGRITYVTVTEEGEKLFEQFDRAYFSELSHYLEDISEEDADCTIRTIERFYQAMSERRMHLE